jgi:hypothetical protein
MNQLPAEANVPVGLAAFEAREALFVEKLEYSY